MLDHFLWVEKYRPKTIADTILPERIKSELQQFVTNNNIPNLLFAGSAGCGKTTAAKAMVEQIGSSYLLINGSLDGNIDTLRTQIKEFASTVSLTGGRKYVILDEADYLTPATQPALRSFMEEFSKNCGFILTCNFKNKIIEPLQSRCGFVEFKFTKQEKPQMMLDLFKRLKLILDEQSVTYDKNVLIELIKTFFPDIRRLINELQKYSTHGQIDSGILSVVNDVDIKQIVKLMKEKNFTEIRKWVAETDIDDTVLFKRLYDSASQYIDKQSIAQLVLIIAKYQYQSAFSVNKDINLVACLVECMIELKFC